MDNEERLYDMFVSDSDKNLRYIGQISTVSGWEARKAVAEHNNIPVTDVASHLT